MNKLFAAALAATTLFASCAKENGTPGQENGDETFAGIKVSVPMSVPTRAGDDTENIASAIETKISNLGVFIVGASTVDKLYLTGTDFAFDAGTGVATASKAVRTTTGAKTIYVVANYSDDLKTAIDNMGVAAFGENAIALDETKFQLATGEMTMTGSKAETLTVMTEADALLPINIKDVAVYRNLAKVVVRQASATSSTIIGGGKHDVDGLQFGMAAKAKGAWLVNAAEDLAVATAYTTVPDDAKASNTHAYWTNFTSAVVGTVATDWKSVSAYTTTPAYQTMPSFYVHENIYSDLFSGNTTRAHLRGKYIPAQIVSAYTAGTRTTIAPSAAASFYRLSDGTYWSEAAYTAATTAAAPYNIPAASFSTKYEGGMGYYQIVVMDEDRVPSVMRNNYYDLSIETIQGPGSPTEIPAGQDPFTPLDEESYVSVKVSVKQWWKQTTGHNIQ